MFKKISLALMIIIAIFMIVAAIKPAEYVIKRVVQINALPEQIFPFLSNTKIVDQWMPWRDIDSEVKMTYSGPDEGVGSVSSWASPGQMGTGKAEVIEVVPNQLVKTKITYTKPMEMSQDSEFSLESQGDVTLMTWAVSGKQPYFARLMCTMMFMDMDKYVGGMFEKGLAKLKAAVETHK